MFATSAGNGSSSLISLTNCGKGDPIQAMAGALQARRGGALVTQGELSALLVAALARAGEPEADIYASEARRGFARFSAGELGQHMSLVEPRALVRVARGTRVAEVTTATLDEGALVAAVQEAAALAPEVPEDHDFPGFCARSELAPPLSARYAPATAESTPEARVDMLAPVLETIAKAGLVATGALDATTAPRVTASPLATAGTARIRSRFRRAYTTSCSSRRPSPSSSSGWASSRSARARPPRA